MANPYIAYYKSQVGNGFSAFQGYQYQRGYGFFGGIYRSILVPLAKYLGKSLLSTGVNVGSDILDGSNLKESLVKNAKTVSSKMLSDGINRAQVFQQTGRGKKGRKNQKKKGTSHKKRNPTKRKSVVKKTSKRKRSKFESLF